MRYENLLATIGNTPLIPLKKINPNPKVNLFAKLEGQNPGGSIKDRVALYLVEQAEKRGELKEGKIIIEATSGNMGIALAMIGASKGYEVHIAMSEGMSDERKMMLRALGAKLILTDKNLGTEGAVATVRNLIKEKPDTYWFANQFNNPDNIEAHYHGVATEILQDIDNIAAITAGAGTSGTIMGIAKKFKEESPKTDIVEVVPEKGYSIQGIQNQREDFSGEIFGPEMIDEQFNVSTKDAYDMAKKVAKTEGLFVGMSSGANLFAATELAKTMPEGSNIVTIIPDRGEKYLSTNLFL